jgi:hypothetical protein
MIRLVCGGHDLRALSRFWPTSLLIERSSCRLVSSSDLVTFVIGAINHLLLTNDQISHLIYS